MSAAAPSSVTPVQLRSSLVTRLPLSARAPTSVTPLKPGVRVQCVRLRHVRLCRLLRASITSPVTLHHARLSHVSCLGVLSSDSPDAVTFSHALSESDVGEAPRSERRAVVRQLNGVVQLELREVDERGHALVSHTMRHAQREAAQLGAPLKQRPHARVRHVAAVRAEAEAAQCGKVAGERLQQLVGHLYVHGHLRLIRPITALQPAEMTGLAIYRA